LLEAVDRKLVAELVARAEAAAENDGFSH
jgi:hypothetical protein